MASQLSQGKGKNNMNGTRSRKTACIQSRVTLGSEQQQTHHQQWESSEFGILGSCHRQDTSTPEIIGDARLPFSSRKQRVERNQPVTCNTMTRSGSSSTTTREQRQQHYLWDLQKAFRCTSQLSNCGCVRQQTQSGRTWHRSKQTIGICD